MAEALLKNVWKYYNDGTPAVSDLNLEIKDEEFVCLLGPSGCGKSSTLRMIAGLESVTKGDIFIGGRNVTNLEPRDRDIAMAFENYALYPSMTVYQNISFPLKIRNLPKDEVRKKVMQAAELMGIVDILAVSVKDLSGGAKQRVGVARALVRNPQVLLLDEPISHLEEELKAKMREELRKLQRALRVTTVYVTHDQIEAMVMADRIAIMNRAVLQQFDTPENVFRKPRNMFVGGFIGEPPMNFIPCELAEEGGLPYLKNDFMKIEIPGAVRAQMAVGDPRLVLGARNTHLKLSHQPTGPSSFAGKVFYVEPRNEDAVVTLDIGGLQILALSSFDFEAKVGDTVYVDVDMNRVSIFDRETTESVMQ